MKTSNEKKPQPYRVYTQYILTGAALGLYYGLFYRGTSRDADYSLALFFSIAAALVTVIVRSWKKGRTFYEIILDFLKIFFFFAVFMFGLELRKLIFMIGGKTWVAVFTTAIGIILGFFASLRKISKPDKKAPPKKKLSDS